MCIHCVDVYVYMQYVHPLALSFSLPLSSLFSLFSPFSQHSVHANHETSLPKGRLSSNDWNSTFISRNRAISKPLSDLTTNSCIAFLLHWIRSHFVLRWSMSSASFHLFRAREEFSLNTLKQTEFGWSNLTYFHPFISTPSRVLFRMDSQGCTYWSKNL